MIDVIIALAISAAVIGAHALLAAWLGSTAWARVAITECLIAIVTIPTAAAILYRRHVAAEQRAEAEFGGMAGVSERKESVIIHFFALVANIASVFAVGLVCLASMCCCSS